MKKDPHYVQFLDLISSSHVLGFTGFLGGSVFAIVFVSSASKAMQLFTYAILKLFTRLCIFVHKYRYRMGQVKVSVRRRNPRLTPEPPHPPPRSAGAPQLRPVQFPPFPQPGGRGRGDDI